jgi:hypothetical protein
LGPKRFVQRSKTILPTGGGALCGALFPEAEERYSLEGFNTILATYKGIGATSLKEHLFAFLKQLVPAAEKAGVLSNTFLWLAREKRSKPGGVRRNMISSKATAFFIFNILDFDCTN